MKPFTMQVEYIDEETGELATETIVIDDFEALPAEPFLPEPDNNDEFPWQATPRNEEKRQAG